MTSGFGSLASRLLGALAVALPAGPGCQRVPRAEAEFAAARAAMVREQIEARGLSDPRLLDALRSVPRHRFVPEELRAQAYADHPLPIGAGQTISQPYIVALMTDALALKGGESVLEVGAGSGYQAAVLAALGCDVWTIEIVPELARRARATLFELGIDRVHVLEGDGYRGWPEQAPFDAVIVTAAPDHVPPPLVDQLREGGRMVIPLGVRVQELVLLEKRGGELVRKRLIPVRFVPMTGEAQRR